MKVDVAALRCKHSLIHLTGLFLGYKLGRNFAYSIKALRAAMYFQLHLITSVLMCHESIINHSIIH